MADGEQVHAQLVRAAGQRFELQPRRSASRSSTRQRVGDGLPCRVDLLARAVRPVGSQRQVDACRRRPRRGRRRPQRSACRPAALERDASRRCIGAPRANNSSPEVAWSSRCTTSASANALHARDAQSRLWSPRPGTASRPAGLSMTTSESSQYTMAMDGSSIAGRVNGSSRCDVRLDARAAPQHITRPFTHRRRRKMHAIDQALASASFSR